MEGLTIFRTGTCDFGDQAVSLSLRVAQDKSIHANCKSPLAKLASSIPYADNYLFSSRSKQKSVEAIKEVIDQQKEYGLTLKPPSHNLETGHEDLGEAKGETSQTSGLR